MAPAAKDPSIDRTSEYEDFILKLRKYHEKRGTIFEAEPKIGQKRVDLLRLYNRVMQDGGYDRVSDTKAEKGQWRNLGSELGFDKATHPSALAFMLKTVYYKNLAAYEISTEHGREPPPKEILEDVSAKGGNLLTRTIENYVGPNGRQETVDEQEGGDTPKGDQMDIDGVGGARATRGEADNNALRRSFAGLQTLAGQHDLGLRQAPPQRQLFQSDSSNLRQTRQQTGHSPAPGYSSLYSFGNATAAQALANYEPKPQIPLAIRPVTTPANNPEQFKANQLAIRDAHLARLAKIPPRPKSNLMLPGTGFPGPNVYIRTWMALKSPVVEEQEYALHHLVKISHEKGDKYRLDNFGGLAEALIDKLLETTSFFYDVSWNLSYLESVEPRPLNVLDALNGTSDIIHRLQTAKSRKPRDQVETDEMTRQIKLINEAGLVMRNMIMLEENADYVSKYPAMRDALVILLHLPDEPFVTEIKHYALEIAEQLSKFMSSFPDDALVSGLMAVTTGSDRGAILTSLRALSRLGTRLERVTPLPHVPIDLVRRLCEWLLVEDLELRSACLDFLYRFTASIDGVEVLLRKFDLESLIRQLVRLLQHGARQEENQESTSPAQPLTQSPSTDPLSIPKISPDHVDMLLTYDEPERSSQWLRACFEEHPSGEITQIALWQAYQVPFTPFSTTRPLLPAKDFITNVSTTFTKASAQVLPSDPPKFVIKGIRPRSVPVDPKGKRFMKCRWILDDAAGVECREFAQTAHRMWEHVVGTHLGVQKDGEGNYDFANMDGKGFQCRWAGCRHFEHEPDPVSPFTVGMHVKTHMPDSSAMQYQRSKHNVSSLEDGLDAKVANGTTTRSWSTSNTFVDERFDATGLPLTSVLVLRNLARNIPRTTAARGAGERKDGEMGPVQALFAPVKAQLYFVMAYNRSLGDYLSSLIKLIDDEI